MGLKTSTMHHSSMELVDSPNPIERRLDDDDSLRFAFSLPCSPTPGFQGQMERRKSRSSLGGHRPTFFLHASNGALLVRPVFKKLEWERSKDNQVDLCVMKWTETVLQINYQIFKEGDQMVNHIPNCGLLTNKLGLLISLRQYEYDMRVSPHLRPKGWMSMDKFVPETYCIDETKDRNHFLSILQDGDIWIFKPSGANQGKGIQLIRSKSDFDLLQEERMQEYERNPQLCKPRLIQRYIKDPLLLDGRKFDIRAYLMIASTMPYLVLFHPGYVRLSTRKYELNDLDLITHLTNQYIQKQDPNYVKMKDDTVWSMESFNDYINEHYMMSANLKKDWVATELMAKMQNIAAHCFKAVKDKLACRIGFFDIYGMDFMVDATMKLWAIEINTNPAMATNCEVLKQVLPPMIDGFLDITIECFEKARRWKPLLPIRGIQPLVSTFAESPHSKRPWSVMINPKLPDDNLVSNFGIRHPFSVLFAETLDAARTRQSLSSAIPLRLWMPPHYPRPEIGEPSKVPQPPPPVQSLQNYKTITLVPLPLKKSPASTKPVLPMRAFRFPNTSPAAKPKVLTHGPTKEFIGNTRPEIKTSAHKASIASRQSMSPPMRGTNVNCSPIMGESSIRESFNCFPEFVPPIPSFISHDDYVEDFINCDDVDVPFVAEIDSGEIGDNCSNITVSAKKKSVPRRHFYHFSKSKVNLRRLAPISKLQVNCRLNVDSTWNWSSSLHLGNLCQQFDSTVIGRRLTWS